MFKKSLVIISSILIVAGLFACGNNAEVEELKRQVAELKQQNEQKQEGLLKETAGTVENFNSRNSQEIDVDEKVLDNVVEGEYTPLLKQIYQSIKNKTEFSFVWPYMREDGTLGKSSRVISPDWIEESKLECKADAKGNLWMKTKLDDYWEEYTGVKEKIKIYFKDGTTEEYGCGYDSNIDKPDYVKISGWGNLYTDISKEEYESKIEEYYKITDIWK